MDLNRTAIFVRVVEQGGFTAAAKLMSLPKSSVSRAVSLLEEELGVRLLQRSTRNVRLTDAGSAFYERASRGIAGVEEAAAAVADMHGALRGTIRITAPADAGTWLLEPAIATFVLAHPGVQVEVSLTQRLVDLVEEGFDLALRAGRLRDGALIARKLAIGEQGLFASPSYLARKEAPTTIAQLAAHDCVLFRPIRGRSTWVLAGPNGEESVEVTGPVSVDDFTFLRSAVLSGVGIGLLPCFMDTPSRDGSRMVRLLPDHANRGGPIHLVYPSARYVPHRVAVFRDYLLATLKG